MSTKKTVSIKPPLFTLVVEYDMEDMSYADILDHTNEIIELASQQGGVISAKLINMPSEVDLY